MRKGEEEVVSEDGLAGLLEDLGLARAFSYRASTCSCSALLPLKRRLTTALANALITRVSYVDMAGSL